MNYDFESILDLPEEEFIEKLHEQILKQTHFDDRLDFNMIPWILQRSVEEQSSIIITMNYDNRRLKRQINYFKLPCILQYYVYCDSFERDEHGSILNYNKNDNITYLYFHKCFDDIILPSDLPVSLHSLYLHHRYNKPIPQLPTVSVKFYHWGIPEVEPNQMDRTNGL
jgi:hypothetical protein